MFSNAGQTWTDNHLDVIAISSGWPTIRTTNASNPANVPAAAGLSATDRSKAQQLVNDLTGSVGTVTQSFYLTNSGGYTPYSGNYQQLRQLDVTMKIEAIVLENAPQRPTLLPIVRELALLSGGAAQTGARSGATLTTARR